MASLNPRYTDLTHEQKKMFMSKLLIAAQYDYFPECEEVITKAEETGLYKEVMPTIDETHSSILDLDNPIERIVFNETAIVQDTETKQ